MDLRTCDRSARVVVVLDPLDSEATRAEVVQEPARPLQMAPSASVPTPSIGARINSWCQRTLIDAVRLVMRSLPPVMARGVSLWHLAAARRAKKPIVSLGARQRMLELEAKP